jgi:hypothetical protein
MTLTDTRQTDSVVGIITDEDQRQPSQTGGKPPREGTDSRAVRQHGLFNTPKQNHGQVPKGTNGSRAVPSGSPFQLPQAGLHPWARLRLHMQMHAVDASLLFPHAPH